MAKAISLENGGTLSWSLLSSRESDADKISGRVDNACPNLTKIGPSSSKVMRNDASGDVFFR